MNALVVVDIQRDFLDEATSPQVGRWQKAFCIPGVNAFLKLARANQWKIAHVGTKHVDKATLPAFQRRRGTELYCKDGTSGCDFIVPPLNREEVIYKKGYSAFAGTCLRRLIRGAENVFFVGVAADCCIQQSVFDGDRHGFRCIVPLQAVSASSCDGFASGLLALAKSAGDVVCLRDYLANPGKVLRFKSEEVYHQAETWFQSQDAVLNKSNPADLEGVLEALGSFRE